MREAAGVPALAGVRWYGSDGSVQSREILGNAEAARFAMRVGFPNSLLAQPTSNKTQALTTRISQRIGSEPQMCALTMYDAVWLSALASVATGNSNDTQTLREALVRTASNYYGVSGWTALNAAGDRDVADYDLWAIVADANGAPIWQRVGLFVASASGGKIVR
jgi:branched-chain amino acid transport system substrate-binding protein